MPRASACTTPYPASAQNSGSGDSKPVQREHSSLPNRTPARRISSILMRSGVASLLYGVTDNSTGAGLDATGRYTIGHQLHTVAHAHWHITVDADAAGNRHRI